MCIHNDGSHSTCVETREGHTFSLVRELTATEYKQHAINSKVIWLHCSLAAGKPQQRLTSLNAVEGFLICLSVTTVLLVGLLLQYVGCGIRCFLIADRQTTIRLNQWAVPNVISKPLLRFLNKALNVCYHILQCHPLPQLPSCITCTSLTTG